MTALVEIGDAEATGQVTGVEGTSLTIACDQESWAGHGLSSVSVSVFAPDALYRLSGPAQAAGLVVTTSPGSSIERVQRRQWTRRRLDLAATVCPVADGRRLEGVPGRTVDLGVGGVCVETLREVEGEGDPMLIISLPDGTSIVSLTTTVGVEDLGDGWRYRLAFRDLDSKDANRILDLTNA
ncbi:MAG TPA: PilZ domain-containing protein [Acidimicrobiales bacterium]|jgi:hypothetical protein|nr:PilZ domain-containing protein [Acidimicrobiales bacterium]